MGMVWQKWAWSPQNFRHALRALFKRTPFLKILDPPLNVPFIFECFHDQQDSQWCMKALQRYQTNNSQNGPNVFLSSDGLARYCVNLSQWFTHETAAFRMEQCTTLLLFHNLEVSQGTHNRLLKNYGFKFRTLFSLLFVCMHT